MGYSDSCITYAGVEPAVLNGGAVLCHPEWPVPLASRIIARLLMLDVSRPILRGQQVLLNVWCLALGSFELMCSIQACRMSAGDSDSNLSAAEVSCDVMSGAGSRLGLRPQYWSDASCLTSVQQS